MVKAVTTKKQNDAGLDNELFDDLDLSTAEQATPSTPLTQLMDDQTGSRPVTPYPPPKAPSRPKRRTATTTSALKSYEEESSNKLVWAIVAVLVLGGGGAGAYFAGVIPGFGGKAQDVPKKDEKRAVALHSTPEGATIKVGEKTYQKQTPSIIYLPVDKSYTVSLSTKACQGEKTFMLEKGPAAHKINMTLTCSSTPPPERRDTQGTAKAPEARRNAPPAKRPTLGYVQIKCTPKGATLQIGSDTKLLCGKSSKLPLEAKSHTVKISKKGYKPYEGSLDIKAGKTSPLTIQLKRAGRKRPRGYGKVTLTSSPSTYVYYRGRKVGKTPMTRKFPATRLRITLKTPFGSKKQLRIRLRPKQSVSKKFTFAKGTMKFFIAPWGEIYINGKKIGQTPIPPQRRSEGVYKILIKKGKKRVTKSIRLYSGKTVRVNHRF
ncbi:MAG: hypothetical protein CL920_36395 [Deltaproteobacteria bacterium]|nr:hypothetical protein [Deltaproteobacteria bacterium]MBU54210.1 hypothetical protein [Deltaproteobacteria bacterium]|tara:strand:+ start:1406 stop:2704 length:1299 start_codon:yes stop_codon:yes gene_type:complete